jgi:outer membrane protein
MKNVSILLNVVLIIAVGILYYLHFKGNKSKTPGSAINSNIVYVNTDSIWNNYKYVEDKKKELTDYEQNLQMQYETKAKNFDKKYKAYLEEGKSGKLSLSQQKKREAELGAEQQELSEYDKKLSSQFMELQQKLNNQIQDSIINFIKKHNQKNNYNYVLGYARSSGILYANDRYDITNDILKGLNESYKVKK